MFLLQCGKQCWPWQLWGLQCGQADFSNGQAIAGHMELSCEVGQRMGLGEASVLAQPLLRYLNARLLLS